MRPRHHFPPALPASASIQIWLAALAARTAEDFIPPGTHFDAILAIESSAPDADRTRRIRCVT